MNIPTEWDIESGKNIKWSRKLGYNVDGNIIVANGKVYVGTNNSTDSAGYLKRYSRSHDLCILLCFRESNGEFLWQYSSEKLEVGGGYRGKRYDWPQDGLCAAPIVEGDRLWLVTNRCEVVCLDSEGFRDGENDRPFDSEKPADPSVVWNEENESDVVWKFDMMKELGVRPHQRTPCSATIWGDVLFICTSNGVDSDHEKITAPDAPSFLAMDKHSGKVLWTDNSPGKNILHVQWSSPAAGILSGIPQVLFPGGDGWLYSFRADRWADGKPELLWKFDGNPKDSVYLLGSRSTRNPIVAVPVIDDGLVYLAMGDDPEHGEGPGHLWCIDPSKRGDVSPELVMDQNGNIVPHQRIQATRPFGDLRPTAVANSNSATVWHFGEYDRNGDGKIDVDETMHRATGSPAIKNNLLFIADLSGFVHCVNAKTGVPHWAWDMSAACLTTPLIVDKSVFVADEDGDVAIFSLSSDLSMSVKKVETADGVSLVPRHQSNVINSIHAMPVVANDVLYIASKGELFAIASGAKSPRKLPIQIDDRD